MRKLFLASYFTKTACMLPDFIGNGCAGKKVAFIPTAALHEEVTFFIDTDTSDVARMDY